MPSSTPNSTTVTNFRLVVDETPRSSISSDDDSSDTTATPTGGSSSEAQEKQQLQREEAVEQHEQHEQEERSAAAEILLAMKLQSNQHTTTSTTSPTTKALAEDIMMTSRPPRQPPIILPAATTTKLQAHLWRAWYEQLCEFHTSHGHCSVPTKSSPLGIWVQNQRTQYRYRLAGRHHRLNTERLTSLDRIGFFRENHKNVVVVLDAQWLVRYNELLRYRQVHGDCLVPQSYAANPALGRWVHQQRVLYKHQIIITNNSSFSTDTRVRLLQKADFVWTCIIENNGHSSSSSSSSSNDIKAATTTKQQPPQQPLPPPPPLQPQPQPYRAKKSSILMDCFVECGLVGE
jgi:Helicase associated domain